MLTMSKNLLHSLKGYRLHARQQADRAKQSLLPENHI